MTVRDETPTPEQKAACERAMDGLEAQADIWAAEVRLVDQVKAMGDVSRGLPDRMPANVRNGFIDRQEAQIDAIARQAYLEGFYRGGESRKAYDETRLTAALSDQVVVPAGWKIVPVEATPDMVRAAPGHSGIRESWRAMIAAAPPPASTAGEAKS